MIKLNYQPFRKFKSVEFEEFRVQRSRIGRALPARSLKKRNQAARCLCVRADGAGAPVASVLYYGPAEQC